jgi:predicted HTH domain antitoxin
MPTTQLETEVRFTVAIANIPEAIKLEAERKAKEAYVMTLLRHDRISTERAAELLGIPRVEIFDLMASYGISIFDDTMTKEDLEPEASETVKKPRIAGFWEGQVKIADDFDRTSEEVIAAFYGDE